MKGKSGFEEYPESLMKVGFTIVPEADLVKVVVMNLVVPKVVGAEVRPEEAGSMGNRDWFTEDGGFRWCVRWRQ